MNDEIIEYIALGAIILGLIIGYFYVLDFSAKDAYFISSDTNSFIDGSVLKYSYGEEKDWSYLEIYSCRSFNAGIKGNLPLEDGDFVKIKGSYSNNFFFIDEIEIN